MPSDNILDRASSLRKAGQVREAIQVCRRAIATDSTNARLWNELAHALRWQGTLDEAYQAVTRAIEADPAQADAWFNLGAILEEQGRPAEALSAYRKALDLDPAQAEAWSNYAGVLGDQGRQKEAIEAYRRAIGIKPHLAPVWSNLGDALRADGLLEEAVLACERATELDPGFAAGWSNLGSALHDAGRYERAIEAGRQALTIDARLGEAWNNLGGCFRSLGRYEEAIEAHEHAVAAQPGNAAFHFNFGITLQHGGRTEAAIARLRRALEIQPENAEARFELSLALLNLGRFVEGWQEYEWRWRRPEARMKRHAGPEWNGDRSRAHRLLLWSEQGIGDQIIYSSMIPDLAASPLRVTLEVDPRLVTLFQRSFPAVAVVPHQEPSQLATGDYDYHAPLASLGRWLRPSREAFPRHAGFLRADPARAADVRARLRSAGPAMRVGISWSSANREFGDRKTTGLADWAAILRVPGIDFVDLQYGDTARERAHVENEHRGAIVHLDDVDVYNDLEGLAALCAVCDLVITVSNVTAHMAGALGRPVWLLAPKARGRIWYWFSGMNESPWYPSIRVYTQQTLGEWHGVLQEVARDLEEWMTARAGPR